MGAVVRSAIYVPRPPEETAWRGLSKGPALVLLAALAASIPFRPHFNLGYDQNPVWTGRPTTSAALRLPAAAPFKPARWNFDHVPDPVWTGGPLSAFPLLSATLQLYAPAAPRLFNAGDISSEVWQQRRQSNFNLLAALSASVPFRPSFNLGYDPDPVWAGRPTTSAALRLPAAFPFFPARWNFNYEADPVWTGGPTDNGPLLIAGAPTFFGAKGQAPWHRWNFDHVPDPNWTGGPRSAFFMLSPPPGQPFSPSRWNNHYDINAPLWNGAPAGNNALALAGAPTFFGAKGQAPTHRWNFDVTVEPHWVGRPGPSHVAYLPAPLPPSGPLRLLDIHGAMPPEEFSDLSSS